MLNAYSQKYLGWCVLLTSSLVTVSVSPKGSIDPINLPKLCVLIVFGSITFGLICTKFTILLLRPYKVPLIFLLIFLGQSLVVFLSDNRDFGLKSYGAFGRNTGYLAYFFLTVMFMSSMFLSSKQFIKKQTRFFLGVGSLLAIYGFFQNLGHDIYEFDNLYGTNVFSTLGNPNFHSAVMGITAAMSLFYGFFGLIKFSYKVTLISVGFLSFWNITVSSEQGYLVFLASLISGAIIFLYVTRKHLFAWILLSISLIGGFFFTIALFNFGPFSRYIYGPSVQARGFYWRSAINIINENPFIGVGFDAYGDWFRRGRTAEIAESHPNVVSDSAHNIPVDIGVSGGLVLLLSYLAIQILVLVSIVQVVRKSNTYDLYFILAAMVWFGYQIQSMISINSLGIGIWGWTISGSIIGYRIWQEIDQESKHSPEKGKSLQPLKQSGWKTFWIVLAAGILGAIIALIPIRAANGFLGALKTQNVEIIIKAATAKPFERNRFLYVAEILNQNQMYTESLQILIRGIEIFPDSYEIWQQISQNPAKSKEQIDIAINELKRLDPKNTGLK